MSKKRDKRREFIVYSKNKKIATIFYDPTLDFPQSEFVQQITHYRQNYKDVRLEEVI